MRVRGQFADIKRDIEKAAQKRWRAVYVFGLPDGSNVRVGTTSDPEDLKATGQSWHPTEVVLHALFWCESKEAALAVEKQLKTDLSPNLLRGAWYDIAPDACSMAIDFAARVARVPVFSEAERMRAIEQQTYSAIRKVHPNLLRNVVPMNRRVS